MVTFRTEDFWTTAGGAAYEYARNLRDEIVTLGCEIWENYPRWMILNNPANSFIRGHLNAVCAPRGNLPAAPTEPFTGGQCDTFYHVEVEINNANTGGGFACNDIRVVNTQSTGFPFMGPVQGVVEIDLGFGLVLRAVGTDAQGQPIYKTLGVPGVGQETVVRSACGNYSNSDSFAQALEGTARIINVIRVDGQPDNCGDPPIEYPDVVPTSIDLSKTIIINNNDGGSTTHNLVYNQIAPNYNFPMGFKLDGVNVTLDIEGITIHGAPQITNPTSDNPTPPPPGSDGGSDGVGGNNDTVFPDQQYPTLPELVIPETVSSAIEYVLCTEGVLETINLVIQQTTSISPLTTAILSILINIVQEICEEGEGAALVGIPEYYGIRPGAERPAIVYLWKEVIGNVIQGSTYSSTVQNPSASAVAAIDTIIVPDKTIGTHTTSITLTDGSRIRATGDTAANADTNFFFLLDQVDATFKPANVNMRITRSQNSRLQVKTLKCRQIEYYPNGKDANTAPSVRRIIPIT